MNKTIALGIFVILNIVITVDTMAQPLVIPNTGLSMADGPAGTEVYFHAYYDFSARSNNSTHPTWDTWTTPNGRQGVRYIDVIMSTLSNQCISLLTENMSHSVWETDTRIYVESPYGSGIWYDDIPDDRLGYLAEGTIFTADSMFLRIRLTMYSAYSNERDFRIWIDTTRGVNGVPQGCTPDLFLFVP